MNEDQDDHEWFAWHRQSATAAMRRQRERERDEDEDEDEEQDRQFYSSSSNQTLDAWASMQPLPPALPPQASTMTTRTATTTRSSWRSFQLETIMNEEDDGDAQAAAVNRRKDTRGKNSLEFILDNADRQQVDDRSDGSEDTKSQQPEQIEAKSTSPPAASRPKSKAARGHVKTSRICKFENCTRYVVNRGLCIGHGGGKRCAVANCTSSAKNLGVCWKHGGSTKCTVESCDNRAKSRGVCWSHGGGKKCKEEGCAKTAVSNELCWAHGGGKRCVVEGCKKPAYERNGNLCCLHQQNTETIV